MKRKPKKIERTKRIKRIKSAKGPNIQNIPIRTKDGDKIKEALKPKRTRRKKSPMVICCNNKCWYDGPCPHKEPHRYSKECEQDFCSYMGIKTQCRKIKEDEK